MIKLCINDFNLKDTLMSGQAFRITEESDSSFTIVLRDRIINVKQIENILYIKSNNEANLKDLVFNYFDLRRDYEKINNELCLKNNMMKKIISKCKGYKILKQDPFEICISYILSQNNNVARISSIVENISSKYGEKVIYDNKEYYLFPKYDKLMSLKSEDYRNAGCGFRDKYLVDFFKVTKSLSFIEKLNELSTEEALKELMAIKGIGIKVASCIMLFGYGRFDVFPIDTWAKQSFSKLYNIKNDHKTILEFSKRIFGEYTGIAIQYMFHYERNKKTN